MTTGHWRDISTAPKDGTRILVQFRNDIVAFTGRDDLASWSGLPFVARHPGVADDGFDIGWGFGAPVGMGGFPDDWLIGWRPVTSVWPDFLAPPQYENPALGWSDPDLPDFRTIWAVARKAGYAVGLHGSMKRDCDLIAAPWVDEPKPVAVLIDDLCRALNARQIGDVEQKPLGRVAVTLQIDAYVKHIDLSIMPGARR